MVSAEHAASMVTGYEDFVSFLVEQVPNLPPRVAAAAAAAAAGTCHHNGFVFLRVHHFGGPNETMKGFPKQFSWL